MEILKNLFGNVRYLEVGRLNPLLCPLHRGNELLSKENAYHMSVI